MPSKYIKVSTNLIDDPDVYFLSEMLCLDHATVVGHLVMFLSWAQRYVPKEGCLRLSTRTINNIVGRENFAEALLEIGWLGGEDSDLAIIDIDQYNSQYR
jgi:hypothetical protein